MHGGRKHVVRRLAHVDLIIGMDLPFHSTHAAQQFAGAVGDHLVHVHIGLRTAAGLPDDQRKLVVKLPCDHFVGSRDDRSANRGILELSQIHVHLRRRAFHQGQRLDQCQRHPILADLEVLQRALGLRAPETVGRNFHFSHRVGLDAELAFHGSSALNGLVLPDTSRRPNATFRISTCQLGCIGELTRSTRLGTFPAGTSQPALLSDAEAAEDAIEDVVGDDGADDPA